MADAANSAAILGAEALALIDHPAISRTLTNDKAAPSWASSATSVKSAASCVQATVSSPSSAVALNVSSSVRHRCRAAVMADPGHAFARLAVSSGIVSWHEHTMIFGGD